MWGSWKVLGPGIPEFFGPQMELAYRLVPISQGPKNSGIPGPNPLPLPQVMYMHPSKTLCKGLYKSQVHRLFYAHEPPGDFNGEYRGVSRLEETNS